MKYQSTRNRTHEVGVTEAITRGLAPDGGLYVPVTFPEHLDWKHIFTSNFPELAERLLRPFFAEDAWLSEHLPGICREAFTFPVPLRFFDRTAAYLELFHGPTMAFKDIGARFLASVLDCLGAKDHEQRSVLVATSGDTGGAVAAAFHGKSHADVTIFFPREGVSARQFQQLTCWGGNVKSYAVNGSFDDCQRLVKEIFRKHPRGPRGQALSSANSINPGRLLPQLVYHYYAACEYALQTGAEPVHIVPTGNMGNALAALWARKLGAPIRKVVLALNANTTMIDYLQTGVTPPERPVVSTLANAMDVATPSNLERLIFQSDILFEGLQGENPVLEAGSLSDAEIQSVIRATWEKYGDILCPHSAVAEGLRQRRYVNEDSLVVCTAHPAKFEGIIEPLLDLKVPVPPALEELLMRQSQYEIINPCLQEFEERAGWACVPA